MLGEMVNVGNYFDVMKIWMKMLDGVEEIYLNFLRLDWIVINCGGVCYEIFRSIFCNFLGICFVWCIENVNNSFEFYDVEKNEYFFDWYFGVFVVIINYYCMGKFYSFYDVCGLFFEDELLFWGIDEK